MIRFLSKYTLRYPRSLVYMLQTTEYYLSDFFEWFYSVRDFTKVEKIDTIKFTKKVMLLLGLAWLYYLASIVKIVFLAVQYSSPYLYLLILLLPILLPYVLALFVILIKYLIQKPIELMIAGKLKKEIASLKAIKIGIAGSYGKTTMREILATTLASGKKVAAPGGSLNTLWGINTFIKSLKGDEEVLIFELGEYYPGDVKRLAEIVQPDMGIITGINEAHLKRFKNIENTVATIYELADYLGEKPTYVNAENELAAKNVRKGQILYSEKEVNRWKVSGAKSDLSGTDFIMTKGKEKLSLHSNLLGLHLVGSLAAAVSIAKELGLNDKQIEEGVANTKPFSRRLELVSISNNVTILDDSYNGNPDGVKAVIDFLASLKGHRIIYITSGLVEMGEKTEEVHKEIARQLDAAGIDLVFLVKTSATKIIGDELEKIGYKGKVIWFDDALGAYEALPHYVVPGDVVLKQNDWPDQYR